LNFSISFGLFI